MSDAGWAPNRRPLAGPLVGPGPGGLGPAPQPTPAAMPGAAEAATDPALASLTTQAAQAAEPTPLPPVVETGHPAVDTALARLATAADAPAESRAAVYGEVHDLLRDTLAGLDERQGQAPTPLSALR